MSSPGENQAVLRAQKRALIDQLQRDRNCHATRDAVDLDEARRRQRDVPGTARQLRRLQAALDRAERGSYGICMQCGERISPTRLAADPSTALCASCKGEW